MKKVKSLLGLTTACAVGLALTITLPLVLINRNNNNGLEPQEKDSLNISFSGNEKPVTANEPLSITGRINKLGNYLYSWCYSKDLSHWTEISKAKSIQLNFPANKVTPKLNDYYFRLTVGNPKTGAIYSATTKVKVVDSRLSVTPISVDRYTAIVNVTPIHFSVSASSCLSDATLSYQWQYRTKTNSVVLNSNDQTQAGWSNCQNATQAKFVIPANQVSLALNNYEFRCVVSLNSGDYTTQQATAPVSVTVGYAIADSNIKLNINSSSADIIQDQAFSLIAKAPNNNVLNYQWYYKSPNSNTNSFAGTNITSNNPVAGWTMIDNAKSAILKVNQEYVTQQLINTEFMVVGYENDKLTYNTATFKVKSLKQIPVTVNVTQSQGPYYVGQTVTLQATAHASSPTQPTFKYQWYYAQTQNNNQDNSQLSWQEITQQTTNTLTLTNVNQNYNDYLFKCVASNQDNPLSNGESETISLNVQQPERNPNLTIDLQTEPNTIYPNDEGVKIVATASCESVDTFNYKWWYKKKSSNVETLKSQTTVQTLESQGWISIPCSSSTLEIPNTNVTMDLNNYDFLCEAIATDASWIFNYNTTSINVEEPPITTPSANPNISVLISGYDNVISGQDLTLTACATCTTPTTINNFSYQWYYKPIDSVPPSNYFFRSSGLTTPETPADPTSGWTQVVEHGNTNKLVIPATMVNPNLANYQFMCAGYQTDNHDNFNLSNPAQIGPFDQTKIVCSQEIIQNLVDNATMKWTDEILKQNCNLPSDAIPITPAVASETLKNQIAEQLGIFPNNIDQILIEPGSSYYQSKKFKANIKVILKSGNTFDTINNQTVTINKDKITLNANSNTLTIQNVLTDIQPKQISNAVDTKANWSAFKSTITGWNWNGIEKQVGKKLKWTSQLDPLYEAGAKLYGINKKFISNIEIVFGGDYYNMRNILRFKFWFKSGVYTNENNQDWVEGGIYPKICDSVMNETAMSSTATVTDIKGVPPAATITGIDQPITIYSNKN